MHIPADFWRQIIVTFEQRGADWLDQLPDLIDAYVRRWSLSVGPAFPGLSFNYLAPATRADGSDSWEYSLTCANLLVQP